MVHKLTNPYVPSVPLPPAPRGDVANGVFHALMAAIVSGELSAGMDVHDVSIAEALSVSRTPVREAVQRLKALGVVISTPNRHTRMIDATPREVREALTTWTGLFLLLCEEVIAHTPPAVVEAMARAHAGFLHARADADADDVGMARTNLEFYAAPTAISSNAFLRDSATRAVLVIRLGGLRLPERIDVDAVQDAQSLVLSGFRSGELERCAAGMRRLRGLRIPE